MDRCGQRLEQIHLACRHAGRRIVTVVAAERPLLTRTIIATIVMTLTICALGAGQRAACESAGAAAQAAAAPVTVTIAVDGGTRTVTAAPDSVAELLAREQIQLGELDRVSPPLTQCLQEGLTVTVSRVTRRLVTATEEVAPPSARRYDHRVSREVELHPGRPGERQVVYEVWQLDGKETARTVVSSRVTRQPQARHVVAGGRATLPSRGGRPFTMVATGYDPGPRSCGRYASGRTAIGLRAGRGVAAVDPRVIPLGTRLYIEGYGPAVAADVGGAIKGGRIDLCFDTYREALSWGRRTVRVYVLE